MTIEELIKALEKIKEDYGNIQVKVQYRDDCGDYWGNDDEVKLEIDTEGDEEVVIL